MVDFAAGAVRDVVAQAQHAQQLGDVAARTRIVAVLIQARSQLDQQLQLLLGAQLLLGKRVAQPRDVAEGHRWLFG
ncbi:hypothetical protein BST12_04135 [Mycobacterium angelicum]|uniref:Uncharacterized protein n=1 Tax=Mycobacterium angelicum TaxID=470074 RepID=A0A1X0A457_MYCAN|nr:hypothetical protein BST12_04135 [Mycobacterium angelicum]